MAGVDGFGDCTADASRSRRSDLLIVSQLNKSDSESEIQLPYSTVYFALKSLYLHSLIENCFVMKLKNELKRQLPIDRALPSR